MNTKQYNGWTNYETWLVQLWIDTEEWSHSSFRSMVKNVHEEFQTVSEVSDSAKEWVENNMVGEFQNGFVADLIGAALAEVNWFEIAEHAIEELSE